MTVILPKTTIHPTQGNTQERWQSTRPSCHHLISACAKNSGYYRILIQKTYFSRPDPGQILSGVAPLRWMIDNTGTHHVQIDIGTATE